MHARPKSSDGFTLLELILVLALLVILYSLAVPAFRGPLATHQLRRGADQVRSEWARARAYAMRTGRTLCFECELDGSLYRIGFLSSSDMAAANHATDADQHLPPKWSESLELPQGVQFASVTVDDQRSFQVIADPATTSQSVGNWSQRVLFFPDGTTSDALVTLNNSRGDQVELRLRGLTGAASLAASESVIDRILAAAFFFARPASANGSKEGRS